MTASESKVLLFCVILGVGIGLASCHCRDASPMGAEELVPVAQYLGHDEATGNRILVILERAGIDSVVAGSLGYTVSVSAAQADRARSLLRAAVAGEGLNATVLGG